MIIVMLECCYMILCGDIFLIIYMNIIEYTYINIFFPE